GGVALAPFPWTSLARRARRRAWHRATSSPPRRGASRRRRKHLRSCRASYSARQRERAVLDRDGGGAATPRTCASDVPSPCTSMQGSAEGPSTASAAAVASAPRGRPAHPAGMAPPGVAATAPVGHRCLPKYDAAPLTHARCRGLIYLG